MSATEHENGKYLYAIINCPEAREFKERGIGERSDPVYTINKGRIAALVSDSPVVEYDNSRRNMMAHTLVLEEAMEEFDLLPVRFGTIAPEADSICERLLERRYEEFSQLLGQMHGRVELGLKAFWYKDVVFDEVIQENPSIRELRDSLAGKSPTESHFDRIRLGEAVEKALTEKRRVDEETILSRIRPHVRKTRSNKIISERMVLNAAFLVDRDKEKDVDLEVQKLDEEFGTRLMFKYVGPVAPYNFVNIVVDWKAQGSA
ncbi:GvpL/GvpF family gas vesicle protein [Flexibacterium corallicola]|uniref:GvpL/GvpF family gas vesicle protein n=1 Tax=Flexibacterium corallicola TaxID=3037259 RepID=UPI00286F9804|nr:GvpL/GvpF family gas vesicle protein [Pseudovibrio sp. M1P-2-3]